MTLTAFVTESNAIEGIHRPPTSDELNAHETFLARPAIDLTTVCTLQSVIAPGKPLRDAPGMNVRVGDYIAPSGGPHMAEELKALLRYANSGMDPWWNHVKFEMLHPFMDGNGRTGRALWAWHMQKLGCDPFALPFLHLFYYQTLERGAS
jgi:hypothetical protein